MKLVSRTTTIAAGAATSAEISTEGCCPVGLYVPVGFTTVDISFTASPTPGGTFLAVLTLAGAALSLAGIAASKYIPLDPGIFNGIQFFKIVGSGNQSALVTLTIVMREL